MQALADPDPRGYQEWRRQALAAFPRSAWALDVPASMWPALADIPVVGPTQEIGDVLDTLATMPARAVQERFLCGLLHAESAVRDLLDGDDATRVVARIPRKKREWLAFVGLYPLAARSPAARILERVVRDPEAFRSDLIATLRGFWEAVFARTWEALRHELGASALAKGRLFESLPFSEFLRHTLLPIEYDTKKKALCALRGGYELPAVEMAACTFTPSVFNARRLWTTRTGTDGAEPWLPYFEPDLEACVGVKEADGADAAADVALVFRALGDATRFALVTLVGRQPRTSVELAKLLSVSKATISHHIHVLRSAGLIREMEHGGAMLISLRKRPFARLSELALTHIFESREAVKPIKTRRNR